MLKQRLVTVLKDTFRNHFTDEEFHSFLDRFDEAVFKRLSELNLYHIKKLNHSEFRHREYDIEMYVFAEKDKRDRVKEIKLTVHWHYNGSGHHYHRQRLWNFNMKNEAIADMLESFAEGLTTKNLVTVRQALGCKFCNILEYDYNGRLQHDKSKSHEFIPRTVEDNEHLGMI